MIQSSECIRQGLDRDTGLYKIVKTDIALTSDVVFGDDQGHGLLAEIITKTSKGLMQLHGVDGPGTVQIKGLETGLPFLNVVPKANKLVEGDCSVIVPIKHVHHQAHRLGYNGQSILFRPRKREREKKKGREGKG